MIAVSVRGRILAAEALLLASVLLLVLAPPTMWPTLASGFAGGLGVFLAAWVLWDLWR